jgi:hypothetical protein
LFILAVREGELDYTRGIGHRQDYTLQARRNGFGFTGEAVDNAIESGLEGYGGVDSGAKRRAQSNGSVAATSFPMGQGIEQHEWEQARLEPKMGSAINGYNFREDLLRMYGNGVVEQVAELAWKTLWKKIKTN